MMMLVMDWGSFVVVGGGGVGVGVVATTSSDCNSESSCFAKLGLTIKNVILIIAGFYRLKLSLHLIFFFHYRASLCVQSRS